MIERFHTKENARIALGIANILVIEIVFLATLMMGYINYFFYYSNGYLVFFVLYLILFVLFGRLFDAFELGDTTTTDLFLSYTLTLIVCNFVMYFILCLITLRLIPVWPILLMQLLETLLIAGLLFAENRYMRDNFPPINVVAIYGEEHYGLIGKLNNIRDLSMSVIRSIDLKDLDYDRFDELL